MSKFEVGSQWKTRGGWRAVIVTMRDKENGFDVFHEHEECIWGHESEGAYAGDETSERNYDLIEPWTEPKSGEVWVNIYDNGIGSECLPSIEAAEMGAVTGRIARIKVKWTEGQFDE